MRGFFKDIVCNFRERKMICHYQPQLLFEIDFSGFKENIYKYAYIILHLHLELLKT